MHLADKFIQTVKEMKKEDAHVSLVMLLMKMELLVYLADKFIQTLKEMKKEDAHVSLVLLLMRIKLVA